MYEAYTSYLNTAKKCEGESALGTCFASSYKKLDGDPYTFEISLADVTPNYSAVLANGVSIGFATASFSDWIFIDTNSKNGPNIAGKDLHVIWLY